MGSSTINAAFSGFDSAWTDRSLGALCHILQIGDELTFVPPKSVSFEDALQDIADVRQTTELHLTGVDQPLIIVNDIGYRPVERVLIPLMSSVKGAIMPSHRRRVGMFDDDAPIWQFLRSLGSEVDPSRSVHSSSGNFVIEVFPAAALIGLWPQFLDAKRAPKYVPTSKNFRLDDWALVCSIIGQEADKVGLESVRIRCSRYAELPRPAKFHQDRLDSVICVLITYLWWRDGLTRSLVVGDTRSGYIVTPTNNSMTALLRAAGDLLGVPVRGGN